MEKQAATISIPDEEWIFKDDIPNPELCFVWECLRCIEKPKKEEIDEVIRRIAINGSSSDWFQRFVRRFEFKPLVLLAWVAWQKNWPSRPWIEECSNILPILEKYERLPALPDSRRSGNLQKRHSFPLNLFADHLMIPLVYQTRSYPEGLNPQKPEIPDIPVFETLRACGLMCQPDFLINWQNYTKDELVDAFDKWLDKNWPAKVRSVQTGGRVEPMAWLQGLGAYRLYLAAKADAGELRKAKKAYTPQYGKKDHSIAWLAAGFFDSELAHFIPNELLPVRPASLRKCKATRTTQEQTRLK